MTEMMPLVNRSDRPLMPLRRYCALPVVDQVSQNW
jgi:hypothetical protein